jgi:trans-aconitate 2-methyltransferase
VRVAEGRHVHPHNHDSAESPTSSMQATPASRRARNTSILFRDHIKARSNSKCDEIRKQASQHSLVASSMKSMRSTLTTKFVCNAIKQPFQTRSYLCISHRRLSTSPTTMASSASDWSAQQYLKFETERTRPARDLLAQIPLTSPTRVVDLGCGPGNSTELLAKQFPDANVTGLDSSPDMVEKARKRLPNLEFTLGDLSSYTPADNEKPDLLYSNAVYQWIPYDQRIPIFVNLLQAQKPGAVFAFQVPDNFNEPSHQAMREVAEAGPWADTLKSVVIFRKPFQSPQQLYDSLKPLCSELNIWHTYYYHILQDHQAIVEWVKATGLRPYLDPLSAEEKPAFTEQYLKKIEHAYPVLVDGKVCLRFPRLFVVAVRA